MKKTANPKPPVPLPLTDRQSVEDNVALVVALRLSRDGLKAQIDQRLKEVKDDLMPKLKALEADLEAGIELVQQWAEANPSEFKGEARSIKMSHGVIGWRKGQPRLEKLSRRWTWERILETLQALSMTQYLRATWEVDKESILADRDKLGEEGLKNIGCKVDQADRFYITNDLGAPELKEAA